MTADGATESDLALLGGLVEDALAAGADAADALAIEGVSLAHAQRLGKTEHLERAEGRDLGLRVLIGRRQAVASTSDHSASALAALVARAVAMARAVPEDPYCGLAPEDRLAGSVPDLDLAADDEPAPEALLARAQMAEEAALGVVGVTNSEGAQAGWQRTRVALAASNGFSGGYAVTRHSVSAAVLAGEGLGMERDYDYATAVYGADLEDPGAVGRRAGERTVRRLSPRKAESARVPVVYEARAAASLVRHFAAAINGAAIARGISFLKGRMDHAVFAPGIEIIDDPHRPRGLASRPFDGEGVATARRALIADGKLTTWLLDMRSARQLGLESTGHAARGTGAPPAPAASNLYLGAGKTDPGALIADIDSGFYVTELIGFGVSNVTGDYSRGAAGFWIEGGEIAWPVSEVTVAGNLVEMFAALTPADDLEFRHGTDAPTVRIEGMTVAGA